MADMYKDIGRIMKTTNGNHFGFDGMTITVMAQYTEYPEGGFYDWHVDNDVNMQHEPPVRKISMTCLLSPKNEFEGGDLELMAEGKVAKIKQTSHRYFSHRWFMLHVHIIIYMPIIKSTFWIFCVSVSYTHLTLPTICSV